MQPQQNSPPAVLFNSVRFGWSAHQPPLLNIPSLCIEQAQHVFLYGPSGSGKSSLLNLIAGINLPTSGSIEVLGTDLGALSNRQRDAFRAQHLGIIFQQFNLIPYLNLLDNLLLRAEFTPSANAADANNTRLQALELLDRLGLSPQLTQPAQALSVGQQQRVAVARALLGGPKIIIADEPTSALDAENKHSFMDLLLSSAQQFNSTIIFVSHDTALQSYFNRTIDILAFNPAHLTSPAL